MSHVPRGGGGEVDWDAVFRTIDDQHVARGGQSGSVSTLVDPGVSTRGAGSGVATLDAFVSGVNGKDNGTGDLIHGLKHKGHDTEGDSELFAEFARQLANSSTKTIDGGPSDADHAESSSRHRKMDRERREKTRKDREPTTSFPSSYDAMGQELPFRAMLEMMSNDHSVNHDTTARSPTTRQAQRERADGDLTPSIAQIRDESGSAKARGRRRSASLIPRRFVPNGTFCHLLDPQFPLYVCVPLLHPRAMCSCEQGL